MKEPRRRGEVFKVTNEMQAFVFPASKIGAGFYLRHLPLTFRLLPEHG